MDDKDKDSWTGDGVNEREGEKEDSSNERYKTNFLKAQTFFKRNLPVHCLKIDREWYNGFILEITNDFFIINERKKGKRVVFFLELYSIEELEPLEPLEPLDEEEVERRQT